ncbi:MAG TPA: hypothetical protein VFU23_10905 [Gemmatimonadales bacterium]|nr:hypothetical protein [Gemmatimonadales bacterium]
MARAFALLLLLLLPESLAGQSWNDPQVHQLIRRAILLRESPPSDTLLRSYRSRAHGFVFYLVQFGVGFPDPPRIAKADELDVEVYWEPPDQSKQRIVAWRDQTFLPQTMTYHRDHLGIVTNNYGPVIRIGDGDEVRDAVHPLSLEGLDEYDFALGDTITLRTPKGPIEVLAVQVKPKSLKRPLVVGTLYLERRTAALVRFQFSFTPAAYRGAEIEDISVVVEQSLLEEKWWLPYQQQIEIRRRASAFEFPARTIIRGKWEIGDYDFTLPMPPGLRAAPEFGGMTAPAPDTARWTTPLRISAEAAEPFNRQEFDDLKARAEALVSHSVIEGLPRRRLGTTAVSDLVRVNRVQGLALGFGLGFQFNGGYALRGSLGYGMSDHRVTAGLSGSLVRGANQWSVQGRRAIRDFGDEPVVSGAVNSLLAQEAGKDLGDYVLGEEIGVGFRRRLDPRWSLDLSARWERTTRVDATATPISGTYRPNADLGSGTYWVGRMALTLAARGAIDRSDLKATFGLELGAGESEYARANVRTDGSVPAPLGHLRLRTVAGLATRALPKAHSFAIGGRGTLQPEPIRRYGGREVVVLQLEWRLNVPVPAIGLGPFASTGKQAIVAPFLAVGWAGGEIADLQWRSSQGARPVAGIALELLQNLLRLEIGTVLRDRDIVIGGKHPRRLIRLTVDVAPEWWPIL